MELNGKTAIVTGGNGGLGRVISTFLAKEGVNVAIVYARSKVQADDFASELSSEYVKSKAFQCDLTIEKDVQDLVEAVKETFGRVDILVNDAIWSKGGTAVALEESDWDRSVAVGLKACYLGAKFAVPAMAKSGGGSIINISSVHGLLAARQSLVYESVKGGLIVMTKQLASDFGPQGIRVNAICPGMIVHEAHGHNPESASSRFAAEVHPMRRYGNPDDIAYAAVYLASDESTFVSGHSLVVDGGMTAQLQDDLAGRIAEYVRENPGTH